VLIPGLFRQCNSKTDSENGSLLIPWIDGRAWRLRLHFEQQDNKRCLLLLENIHRLMRFEAEWLGRVSRFFCFERPWLRLSELSVQKSRPNSHGRGPDHFLRGASILRKLSSYSILHALVPVLLVIRRGASALSLTVVKGFEAACPLSELIKM
jgi:hypothetical protein